MIYSQENLLRTAVEMDKLDRPGHAEQLRAHADALERIKRLEECVREFMSARERAGNPSDLTDMIDAVYDKARALLTEGE